MAESHRTGQVRRDSSGVRAGVRWTPAVRLLGAVAFVARFHWGSLRLARRRPASHARPRAARGRSSRRRIGPALASMSSRPSHAPRGGPAARSAPTRPACPARGSPWQRGGTARAGGSSTPSFPKAQRAAPSPACPARQRPPAPPWAPPSARPGRSVNLAEAWNGTSWRVQAIPIPRARPAVRCSGSPARRASACTAVGDYGNAAGRVLAVAERWNGKAWRIQAIPRPAKVTQLFGVSCPAARACTAVGYQNTGTGDAQPLAEAWNGTKWHIQAVPLPRKAPGGALSAVSCTAPSACTATGTNFSTTGPTLAERWNGTNWRVQPTPNPPNFTTSREEVALNGVSCTSATACTASGQYAPGGKAAYFIEAWNGRSWRLVTAPLPAGFAQGALNGMSCAPARCAAVGAWSGGPSPWPPWPWPTDLRDPQRTGRVQTRSGPGGCAVRTARAAGSCAARSPGTRRAKAITTG